MPKQAQVNLTPSLEDYLEAVFIAVKKSRVARVRDLSEHLGVGMPAVTAALKTLSKQGLVNYEPYQFITLTQSGRELANEISRRHRTLEDFFVNVLGVNEKDADANACRIEHVMDKALLNRLKLFAQFVEESQGANDLVNEFLEFCSNEGKTE